MQQGLMGMFVAAALVTTTGCDSRECRYYNECGEENFCTPEGSCDALPVSDDRPEAPGWQPNGNMGGGAMGGAGNGGFGGDALPATVEAFSGAIGRLAADGLTLDELRVESSSGVSEALYIDLNFRTPNTWGFVGLDLYDLDRDQSETLTLGDPGAFLMSCSDDYEDSSEYFDNVASGGTVVTTPLDDGAVQIDVILADVEGATGTFSATLIVASDF